MIHRLLRAIKNRSRILLRYWRPWGYNSAAYWKDRHREYGFNLQGVGEKGLSQEENQQVYRKAQKVYLQICDVAGVDFRNAEILDVGCGNGFYTTLLQSKGASRYTGIDIADTLFGQLGQQFPDFRFLKLDIAKEHLSGSYDLIQMIDVTQHITSDTLFNFAMQNLASSLNPGGVIILTSWLQVDLKDSFYEKSRTLEQYKSVFPAFSFSEPVPFRDKYIFSLDYDKSN